jgi:ATP-dependent DNA helicase RecG
VRALVDLGLMRDQGEGIPRMFAEMEGLFLPAPTLESSSREFRITLRNTPTLTADDRTFVALLGDAELTDQEFRALLECHRAGRIDNARMRAISGLDTLGASALLRKLRDRELLQLHSAGAASFYELGPKASQLAAAAGSVTGEFASQTGGLEAQTGEFASQTGGLEAETRDLSGALSSDAAELVSGLPVEVRAAVEALGGKPAQGDLRRVLVEICELRWWTPRELALIFNRKDPSHLSEKHLAPLVKEGVLERKYPDNLAHPQQAYRARQSRLPTEEAASPKG